MRSTPGSLDGNETHSHYNERTLRSGIPCMRSFPRPGALPTATLAAAISCVLAFTSLSASAQASSPDAPAASDTASSPDQADATLPAVTVHGIREIANGPVEGYAARRSATGTKTDTSL